MCLIIDKNEPIKVAQEDIEAYKILVSNPSGGRALFQDFYYNFGELYKMEKMNDIGLSMFTFDQIEQNYLEENYPPSQPLDCTWDISKVKCISNAFHGIVTLERAINILNDPFMFQRWANAIYIVIIPKGAEYYTSPTGLFASNQIIIKEKVKP